MLDSAPRLQFLRPNVLQVDLAEPIAAQLRIAVLIARVVHEHGGEVALRIGGRSYDASSVLELVIALASEPEVKRLVFHGRDEVLVDLERLCQHVLIEGRSETVPEDLAYLRSLARYV